MYPLTGNCLIGPWLYYISVPLYNLFVLNDDNNIAPERSEKAFMKSKLFLIPLYAEIVSHTFYWLYCLLIFSTKFQIDHWVFNTRPETFASCFYIVITSTFFGMMPMAAGHEIIHYKHPIHKIVGSWPFSICFFTHYWSEHTQNHHKNVGTDEDPASAPKGRSMWTAAANSVVYSHTGSWEREVDRISRQAKANGNGSKPSTMEKIIYNKMTWYFILHVSLCLAIF